MSENTILIVEDEFKIAKALQKYLENEGFKVIVLHNGASTIDVVKKINPIMCILDLMLPDADGLSICISLRQESDIPIIILTAKNNEEDKLTGLKLGADDYICKPFSPREVVARVHSILRRTKSSKTADSINKLQYNDITLLVDQFECFVNEVRVELTPLEFRMLKAFVMRPKKVFSRDDLMQESYTSERIVSNRTVDTHVKNLRKKLLVKAGEQKIISIYGVGYKLA